MKNTENKGFNFSLPFDPFRLLLAVLEKLGLVVIAALVCAALGIGYAVLKLGNTYSTSIVMASDGWHSKRGDESSAYVPLPITDEAIVIAADAEEVFEIAAKKLGPDVPGGAVRSLVGLEQLPGDGMFRISANTADGKEQALKVATAYSEALMDYTALLRQREARNGQKILEKKATEKQRSAKELASEIVKFSGDEGFLDPDSEAAGVYKRVEDLKKQLSDARTLYRTDLTLDFVRKSLVGPLKADLANLLAVREESDHLVLRKRDELEKMEALIAESSTGGNLNLKGLEMVLSPADRDEARRLQRQRKVLENTIEDYTTEIENAESTTGALSEKTLKVREMTNDLNQREKAASIANEQLKDAEFYANNAPPALSIFRAPTLNEVEHRSTMSKAITLGVLGLFGGAAAVIGLSLVLELVGRKVRTPMQAAIAAGAYPKLVYPPSRKTPNEMALRGFWIRGIARFLPGDRRMLFPVIGDVQNESAFWGGLFESLQEEDQRVVFVDFSNKPLDLNLGSYDASQRMSVSTINPFQYSTEDLKNMVANFPEGHVLIIRWDMNPTSTLVDLAPHIDRHYLVTSQEVELSRVEEESRSYREVFGDADGLVLVNSKRPKRSQMIVNRLQDWYLEGYRRKSLRQARPKVAPIIP